MPRAKSVTPEKRLVNHEELRALVTHISAINAALEVRLAECERVLAVNPEVGESAADFLARIRKDAAPVVRALTLGDDTPDASA